MTARLDVIGSDGPEVGLSRGAPGDDPLAIFQQEPQNVGEGSGGSAALLMDAIPSQASSVPFATPSVNDGKPRTAGVVNRIKRVLRALDIASNFEKTVDNRLAALRGLDQEVRDRAGRLEWLNQEIIAGAAHAEDILRAIGSFERPLADLRWHQQDLRAIETAVAAFEKRAQTVSTSLGGHVAAWEARKAAVVDAVEQLGRRAADTIDDLEARVRDCEARARIAEQTITRLDDVSSRTLPVLQERTKEAEEQNQSLGLVTEAARMATSLTALEEPLPAVGQPDQDLARIELAAPQIASELAGRIVDLSGSHQQLDRLEKCVTQLEQRAAAAVGEVRHATRAKDDLQREIAKCQQQIERLTTAAQSEVEKLNGLRRHAEDLGGDRAASPSAHDLLYRLRFPRLNTLRGFSPPRLIFGGAASALFAVIILLVGIVWRINPVENQRPEKALRATVLASRALTLAPTLAVAATRTAPAVPAVPVPPVAVSKTPVATRGVPTAAVREQSVRKDATTPQFVGTLLIESDPVGAAVFVNHEPVGDTPVLLKDLRAGSYVVRLEFEGYQRWSTAATVSAVRQERVKAKLERERSR